MSINQSDFLNSENPLPFERNEYVNEQQKTQDVLISGLFNKDFSLDNWIMNFSDYATKYDRFLYSSISATIINTEENEKIDILNANLTYFIEHCKTDSSIKRDRKVEKEDIHDRIVSLSKQKYTFLYKLFDHCNLAIIQREAYNTTGQSIRDEVKKSFNEQYQIEYDENIKPKFDSFQKDITGQLISLVSIFTALSFLVFGSISILDNLLINVQTSPIIKVIFVGIIWLLCMFNIFYLFAHFICKLIDKNDVFKLKHLIIINIILVVCLIVICSIAVINIGTRFLI